MRKNQLFFFKRSKLQHVSSSYAKILGETNFHTQEFPEMGQKQKTERKRERERERAKVSNNNG